MMEKALPIGMESFTALRQKAMYYVDKTPFIRPVLEHPGRRLLLLRPPQFGKSLFLSTLKSFLQLDWQRPGDASRHAALFRGLVVEKDGDLCERFMGQYPVVHLSLKGAAGETFAAAETAAAGILAEALEEHRYLLESPQLSKRDKAELQRYFPKGHPYIKEDSADVLRCLVRWLSKHFGRQVMLLIDDVDVPLRRAAQHGYFDEMGIWMRQLLGPVLSEWPQAACDAVPYLAKAVMTGTVDVNRELFDDLCPTEFSTVLREDRRLAEAAGFSLSEVAGLLRDSGWSDREEDFRRAFGGYRFGASDVICPAAVLRAVKSGGVNSPLSAADDEGADVGRPFVEAFLGAMTTDEAELLQALLDGESVVVPAATRGEPWFREGQLSVTWGHLLQLGYLTVEERIRSGMYRVRVPNTEVRRQWEKRLRRHFSENNSQWQQQCLDLGDVLTSGDGQTVRKALMPLLRHYVATTDVSDNREAVHVGELLENAMGTAGYGVTPLIGLGTGTPVLEMAFSSAAKKVCGVIGLKRCAVPQEMPAAARAAVEAVQDEDDNKAENVLNGGRRLTYGIGFCGTLCVVAGKAQS